MEQAAGLRDQRVEVQSVGATQFLVVQPTEKTCSAVLTVLRTGTACVAGFHLVDGREIAIVHLADGLARRYASPDGVPQYDLPIGG